MLDAAEIMVQQLREFGFDASLDVIERAKQVENRGDGNYLMQFDGTSAGMQDPDFYTNFVHSQSSWFARGVGYNNPRIDEILEDTRTIVGFDERKENYKELERELLEDAPWILLIWRGEAYSTSANVKNFHVIPALPMDSLGMFKYIWLE